MERIPASEVFSARRPSFPGWLIAWLVLISIVTGFYLWSWIFPSGENIAYGEVQIDLSLIPRTSEAGDPFLPQHDVPRIPQSELYAVQPIGTGEDYRVSIIMTNLGLDEELLRRASQELPLAVDFALRSDTPNLQDTIDELRSQGREVLLMVPMEPEGYPHNDPGPEPLLTSNATEENLRRIASHTEKAKGVIGVGPFMGKAFTRDTEASEPIASWLAANGYALLDFTNVKHRSHFVESMLEYGGTYIDNPILLTEGLSDDHMKLIKLEYMETVAKRDMISVGIIDATPTAIPFLNNWLQTLPKKKILLTPVSSVYLPDSVEKENLHGVPNPEDISKDNKEDS